MTEEISKHGRPGVYHESEDTMDKAQFETLLEQLDKSGRIKEILNADGTIKPSKRAIERIEAEYPDASDAEKYRLFQAATLMELAQRYQGEKN